MKKGKAEEEKPLITPDAPVQKERELQVRVDVHDAKRKSVGAKEFPHHGLSSDEAARRLAQYGPNSVEEKGKPTWRLLLEKFIGPMEILIEIAVILSLMNGIFSPQHDYVSFVVLLVLLLINGFIGFFEERNAGKAIAALKKSLAPKCSVNRDGKWITIEAANLVPGDLITMKLGDIVPADCELSPNSGTIEADESALTGESLPVNVGPGEAAKSGAIIRKGEVEAVITATGKDTYIGEAMALVAQSDSTSGRFQKVLFGIAKVCVVASFVSSILIFCVKIFKNHERALPVLDLCLVLLVASIPITMQVVCTGTLAVGSRRLAEHNVVVSRLGAIEELAGMTVLCSDKTGTLTQNKLQMREPWLISKEIDANEIGFLSALASKRVNPDAIDFCVIQALPDKKALDDYQELDFMPFDPISKRTEATVKSPRGNVFKVTKGAPQVILHMAYNKDEIEESVDNIVKEYAERGLRTLGVARTEVKNTKGEEIEEKWTFLGVLSFHDPPRIDTKETIEKAKQMGSDVKMITGDHLLIGKETARLLGMGQSFYGKEFLAAVDDGKANIDGVDVSDIVEAADGFAQVAPKHKYFIVDVLQKRGHVTGMTGDGVNDAPALKKADIGIAVEGATEAAKAAADIVLLTPGLSVIITGILRSRKIFQRMKNYCIYRITCTIQLLLFFTVAIIFLNFSVPAMTLVVLTLLNDGTVMTISYDKVIPAKKPETWKLTIIYGISIVVGVIITLALFGMYFLYTVPFHGDTNFFGYHFSDQCYYSLGPFPNTNITSVLKEPSCSPACPGAIPKGDVFSCGDYVGWSELQTIIYLTLSIGGQLTVFVSRTRHSFWSRRPGYSLLIACILAQVVATLLSVYLPVSLRIDSYVGIPLLDKRGFTSTEVIMKGIDWKMAGFVWVFCTIIFVFSDFVKVYFYYALDNDNQPDDDIIGIKKQKKPFLPNVEQKKEKKKKNNKKGKEEVLVSLP